MKINYKESHRDNFIAKRTSAVKYIVMHYTGNKGDTAKNNADYFARESVGVSAHYFVDEREIWQSVKDSASAQHCGGKRQSNNGGSFFGVCMNNNSIGVEICMLDKKGRVRNGSIDNAAELVRYLMQRYNVPSDRVIRHYDVTGKYCPGPMVDSETLWQQFKYKLEDEEVKRYNTVKECPDYAKEAVQHLIDRKYLQGEDGGLNLSEDMLRLITINYRAGLY